MKNERLALWIGVIMLLLAVPTGFWPYSYYVLLRWVITAASLYIAYSIWQLETLKAKFWVYILVVIAVVFNPITPIYMEKENWVIVDLFTAVIFTFILFFFKNLNKKI